MRSAAHNSTTLAQARKLAETPDAEAAGVCVVTAESYDACV